MARPLPPLMLLLASLVFALSTTVRSEPPTPSADELFGPPAPPLRLDAQGDPLPTGVLARLGTKRFRQGGGGGFVSFAAEGKELIVVDKEQVVRVLETATGKELRRHQLTTTQNGGGMSSWSDGTIMVSQEYNGNSATVTAARDGRMLAILGNDGLLRLWDVAAGKEARQVRSQAGAQCPVVFAPDGKTLAVKGWDGGIALIDPATGKETRKLTLQSATGQRANFGNRGGKNLAFSPDGKELASGEAEQDGKGQISTYIQIWETATGKQLRRFKIGENMWGAESLLFAPDGKTLAVASPDNAVRLLDVASGKELQKIQQTVPVAALAFTSDGKTLALKPHGDGPASLWDAADGKMIRRFGVEAPADNFWWNNNQIVPEIAFSPDDKTLVVGSTKHGVVRLFDVATGKDLLHADGHRGRVVVLAASADGKTATTWGDDGTVRQWDRALGKELRCLTLPLGAANPTVSPDGRLLAFGIEGDSLRLWDLEAGKELRAFSLGQKQPFSAVVAGAAGLAFSPDGKTLTARHIDATVRRWSVADGKAAEPFSVRSEPQGMPSIVIQNGVAPGIAYTPDGEALATVGNAPQVNDNIQMRRFHNGNSDQVLRLWNATTGRLVRQFEVSKTRILTIAASPDGRNIAASSPDGNVVVWETATGKERFKLEARTQILGQGRPGGVLTCLAFSPNGRFLAAGGDQKAVYLWDVAEGRKIGEFTGHEGAITSVAFGADGRSVFSGSTDTTALIWDATELLRIKPPTGGKLTDAQRNAAWEELAGGDAAKAVAAVRSLASQPEPTAELFRARLKPAEVVAPGRIDQLIAELSDPVFETRQRAHDELARIGERAGAALRKLQNDKTPLDARTRVESLLADIANSQASPDLLRGLRALEVLERIGTPEARAIVDQVAHGAPGAWLTREAQGVAGRLERVAAR